MQIVIRPNSDCTGYHAVSDDTYEVRYGATRGEALGRLVMAFPDLLAIGVAIAHEDDPRPETVEDDHEIDPAVEQRLIDLRAIRPAPTCSRQMADSFAMPEDELEPPSVVTEVVAERCDRWARRDVSDLAIVRMTDRGVECTRQARRNGPRPVNPSIDANDLADIDEEAS